MLFKKLMLFRLISTLDIIFTRLNNFIYLKYAEFYKQLHYLFLKTIFIIVDVIVYIIAFRR